MSAGDTMQGTRLPDDASHEDVMNAPAGCYRLAPQSHNDDRTRYLHMMLPNGAFAMIPVGDEGRAAPPVWALTEHDDGTISISPSILLHPTPGLDGGWHGYLERGVWREV